MYSRAVRIVVIFVLVLSSMSILRGVHAATPASGTLSETSQTVSWNGAFYTAGVNADPSTCPPSTDPLNLLCDHFLLNIKLASDFWTSQPATATIRTTGQAA